MPSHRRNPASEWGGSENGRRVKYYALARAGRRETREWDQATAILARFLKPSGQQS